MSIGMAFVPCNNLTLLEVRTFHFFFVRYFYASAFVVFSIES